MSRRQAREVALQALFQLDLNPAETAAQEEMQETLALDTALGEAEAMSAHDRAFAAQLVHGTRERRGHRCPDRRELARVEGGAHGGRRPQPHAHGNV